MCPTFFQVKDLRNPSTFIYSNTTLVFNVSATAGRPAMIGVLGSNITTPNQSFLNVTNNTNLLYSAGFLQTGLQKLYFIAFNELTFNQLELIIPVASVYPVKSLNVSAHSWILETGVNHTFWLMVSGGSDYVCNVSYGDGTSETINRTLSSLIETSTNDEVLDLELRNPDTNQSLEFFKTFITPGTYLFEVHCANSLTNVEFVSLVSVLNPIVKFSLIPLPAQAFGELITVKWNMSQGTNVTAEIFYNDIFCCKSSILSESGGQCGCLVSDPGRYDVDGLVNIRAMAWNLVSNASDIIQVFVLNEIKDVSISMLTSYSNFGSGVEGRGNQRNVFPAVYPVKFNSSHLNGPALVAEWTFSCSISGVTTESGFFFDKLFPKNVTQSCNITLVLKNNMSTAIASRTIELVQSIIFNSMTNDGPVKLNQTMVLVISFETFGSGTCVTVDMNDNSSLLVFGEPSCETKFDVSQINPNILTEPRLIFSKKTSSTEQIVIHHHYHELGTYVVKMNASNYVSMVTEETVAVVMDYDCENPNVTITGILFVCLFVYLLIIYWFVGRIVSFSVHFLVLLSGFRSRFRCRYR